jgi:hypothetical protein
MRPLFPFRLTMVAALAACAPAGLTLHRIVFETDGQRVRSYRAGRRPTVASVEGCA